MKRNFITAKADFDKYVKLNLKSNKNTDKDSITAKESQVKELITDSQNKIISKLFYADTNVDKVHNPQAEESSINLSEQENDSQQLDENSFNDDSLSKILSIKSTKNNDDEDINMYEDSSDNSYSSSSSSSSSSSNTQSSNQKSFGSQDIFDSDSSSTNFLESKQDIKSNKRKSKRKKHKKNKKKKKKKSNKQLNSDKVCQHSLSMIKILGTLHMKKLDLKYEPRLRQADFIEWISQLEIAFSSNKYTKDVLKDYSTKNKINKSD